MILYDYMKLILRGGVPSEQIIEHSVINHEVLPGIYVSEIEFRQKEKKVDIRTDLTHLINNASARKSTLGETRLGPVDLWLERKKAGVTATLVIK